MANIAVRSPYFVSVSTSGGAYAILSVTSGGTTYNIRKDATGYVDIADIARDAVTPTYSGAISSSSSGGASVTGSYTIYDSSGSVVSSNQGSFSHTAYDGYGYFEDGNSIALSGTPISGTEIWFPENTSGAIYTSQTATTSFTSTATSVSGITINRFIDNKYTAIKAAFINKFGVPQELWFFGTKREYVSSEGDTYKVGAVNGTYSTTSHQQKTLVKNGRVAYTLNTGFVSEVYNEYIREMMVSEQVWLVIDGVTRPVHPVSSSVELKTSINEKLVNYTVDFEQANDLISTVR
jgi:hypothetical protein